MGLIDIQQKLLMDLPAEIWVLTREEYIIKYPGQQEAWLPGHYLIVMDNELLADFNGGPLSGAYAVEVNKEGGFEAIWLPYPDGHYTDIEVFIESVNQQVKAYNASK